MLISRGVGIDFVFYLLVNRIMLANDLDMYVYMEYVVCVECIPGTSVYHVS